MKKIKLLFLSLFFVGNFVEIHASARNDVFIEHERLKAEWQENIDHITNTPEFREVFGPLLEKHPSIQKEIKVLRENTEDPDPLTFFSTCTWFLSKSIPLHMKEKRVEFIASLLLSRIFDKLTSILSPEDRENLLQNHLCFVEKSQKTAILEKLHQEEIIKTVPYIFSLDGDGKTRFITTFSLYRKSRYSTNPEQTDIDVRPFLEVLDKDLSFRHLELPEMHFRQKNIILPAEYFSLRDNILESVNNEIGKRFLKECSNGIIKFSGEFSEALSFIDEVITKSENQLSELIMKYSEVQ